MMKSGSLQMPVNGLANVVTARRKALNMATSLGFVVPEATKIAVVVSELARNIINYTEGGTISLSALETGRRGIKIVAQDQGPGIENLDLILAGNYISASGMGGRIVRF